MRQIRNLPPQGFLSFFLRTSLKRWLWLVHRACRTFFNVLYVGNPPLNPCYSVLRSFTTQVQTAFSSISGTGCQLTCISCTFEDQSFIDTLLPFVEKAWSPSDLQGKYQVPAFARMILTFVKGLLRSLRAFPAQSPSPFLCLPLPLLPQVSPRSTILPHLQSDGLHLRPKYREGVSVDFCACFSKPL